MKEMFFVTGANGHLGFNICQILRANKYHVRGLIIDSDSPRRLEELGVEVFRGDVTKPHTLSPFFANIEPDTTSYLIHTAGIVSITNKNLNVLYRVNFEGTKNVIKSAKEARIDRIVYVSSVHAIPENKDNDVIIEPTFFDENLVVGEYAKTKAITSKYVKNQAKKGLDIVLVHPSGIIGPGDQGHGHLTMMVEDYLNGLLTSRVKGAYDFVDVRDVAQGTIQAALKGKKGESYILSGHLIDLSQFFEVLRKLSGKNTIINVLPTWFARISAPLAELYYKLLRKPPIYSKYSLYTIQSNAQFSYLKAQKVLDYSPRPFEETIKATMKWLLTEGRIKKKKVANFVKKY